MRHRAEARISELQHELDAGNRRLQELELEQARLREVMLRITGALQVLRELLNEEAAATNGTAASAGADGVEVEVAADGDGAAKTTADAVMG
ncbi:MAG: hypothetical protein ACXVFQ_01525 [Solirubrobacteraceae bacterium]